MLAPNDILSPSSTKTPILGPKPKIPDPSRTDVKKTPMNIQSPLPDGLLDREIGHQHLDAVLDIQLRHPDGAGLLILDTLQFLAVGVPDCLEGRQPGVEDAAHPLVSEGCRRAAAGRVAAEDDVLYFDDADCELDHGRGVDVRRGDDVGDITVDEDVAWLQAQDCRFRAAGVGAAEPDCWGGGLLAIALGRLLYSGYCRANIRMLGDCPAASFGKKLGFWCDL
jgi:hypothetical protein